MRSPNIHAPLLDPDEVHSQNVSPCFRNPVDALSNEASRDQFCIAVKKRKRRFGSRKGSSKTSNFTSSSDSFDASSEANSTTILATPPDRSPSPDSKIKTSSSSQETREFSISELPFPVFNQSGRSKRRRKSEEEKCENEVLELFPMKKIPKGKLKPVHITRLAKLPDHFGGRIFNLKILMNTVPTPKNHTSKIDRILKSVTKCEKEFERTGKFCSELEYVVEKSENTQKSENAKRSENTQKSEIAKRSENTQKSENGEKSEKSQKCENGEKSEKSQKCETGEKSKNTGKSEKSEKSQSFIGYPSDSPLDLYSGPEPTSKAPETIEDYQTRPRRKTRLSCRLRDFN